MDTIKEPTTHNEKFMISKEELEELYCVNKMTQLEIANKFSVSRITVGKLFRNYNIESRRSRKKNYSFLEHDNSEIAFALGFIYGNSYFGTHPNNKQKPFIKIYSSKLFWINKIKKIIKTDYKIGHRLPKIYNGRKINEIYWIHIENPKVIDELNRIGINKEKHLTFDINILNEISFLNFIRGYLSTNGVVTKVKRKPYVHLNSRSQALIMTVNKRLRRLRINDCRIETINRIKSTTYRLIFENPKDISRLFYFLYYNVSNDIVFEEEKVKFEKILKT